MFKKYKNIFQYVCVTALVISGVVMAGEINNNSAPNSNAIPYTLADIYSKLTDPGYTSNPSHTLDPIVPTNTNTMFSLEELFNVIPAHKTLDGSTTTVEAGIYATTTLSDIPSSGLLPENIASGTTMFGITGTYNCTP